VTVRQPLIDSAYGFDDLTLHCHAAYNSMRDIYYLHRIIPNQSQKLQFYLVT